MRAYLKRSDLTQERADRIMNGAPLGTYRATVSPLTSELNVGITRQRFCRMISHKFMALLNRVFLCRSEL